MLTNKEIQNIMLSKLNIWRIIKQNLIFIVVFLFAGYTFIEWQFWVYLVMIMIAVIIRDVDVVEEHSEIMTELFRKSNEKEIIN